MLVQAALAATAVAWMASLVLALIYVFAPPLRSVVAGWLMTFAVIAAAGASFLYPALRRLNSRTKESPTLLEWTMWAAAVFAIVLGVLAVLLGFGNLAAVIAGIVLIAIGGLIVWLLY